MKWYASSERRSLFFQFPFEVLFRSEQLCLVENACREFAFVTEFFMVSGNEAMDNFNQIMGRTMTILTVSALRCISAKRPN